MNPIVKAHSKAVFLSKPAQWEPRGDLMCCSYCGSMSVEDAIRLLQTDGTRYSGADWKYGWPHKFYIGDHKFYATHLEDADDATFLGFSELSKKYLGIGWEKGEDALRFNYPFGDWGFHGYQRWGAVGKTICDCGCIGGERMGRFCSCQICGHPPLPVPET